MNSIAGRDLAVSAGAVSSNPGAGSSRVLHVELTSQQVTLHLQSQPNAPYVRANI